MRRLFVRFLGFGKLEKFVQIGMLVSAAADDFVLMFNHSRRRDAKFGKHR